MNKTYVVVVALALMAAGCATTQDTGGDGSTMGTDGGETLLLEAVPMVNHVQFGVFEQDVFIERVDGEAGMVYRPTPEDAANPLYADAPLFSTAEAHEHDPTFQDAGPFEKGATLGFTLSEWLAGTGSAAYACDGDGAQISATFAKLVPDGLYTVWNAQLTFEEGGIVGGQDLPAGPSDGTGNTFTADDAGNARFSVSLDDCTEPSTFDGTDGTTWVIAIAYHSDGNTYGEEPGPFGQASHVQLFGMAVEGGG